MNDRNARSLSPAQQAMLVLLRVLIGWHFLYEGYYKLVLPAWSASGQPLGSWSSIGYLKAASGPLGSFFRHIIDTGWIYWIDRLVVFGLVLVGLSLMLGLFTRLGCLGAILLLMLFYLSSIPVGGAPQPGNEGTYLVVNKNLIELAAVLVLLVFRTGEIAGLDMLWHRSRKVASEQGELEVQSTSGI
ncbi:MAG: DoxX family protein [Acidobacteria bacterium]|nr:DoxX family protein [Acidobacteriota bacterium]